MPTNPMARYNVTVVYKNKGARKSRYERSEHRSYALAIVHIVRAFRSGDVVHATVFDRRARRKVGTFNQRRNPLAATTATP